MLQEYGHGQLKISGKRILPFGIAATWVACIYFVCGIYFETNDDKLLTEILSGVITMQPEGHAVYMHYLLAKPLSLLYRFLPGIPWYGFSLVFIYVLGYTVILNAIFRNSENKGDYLAGGLATAIFLILTLRLLSHITFTSTAAFLAVAGYTYLLSEKSGGRRKYVLFFLLECLAFLLRENAMLMIQPMGIAVWCGVCFEEKDVLLKERLRKQLEVIAVVFLIVFAGTVADKVVYSGSEWKEYMSFKNARETLFDFYGTPEYSEVKEILDKYDVTEAEYAAYTHYVILDYDVSAACTEELAEYVKENRARNMSFSEGLRQMAEQRFQGEYFGINKVSTVIWIVTFAWIFMQKRYRMLLPVLGLGAGETIVWYFMIWRGRIPWRVTAPLFICDIFLLTILIWKEYTEGKVSGKWRHVLFAGMLGCMFFYMCKSGIEQCRYVIQDNRGCEIMSQSMYEIDEYCRKNPDNRYLLGSNSMIYFRGGAFDTQLALPQNSVLTGNWFSNSPPSREYLKHYLGEENTGVYLIVYAEAPIDFAAMNYLEEKMRCVPVEADSFSTTSGAVYTVYYFGE